MQERIALLTRLSHQAGVKEKAARLAELAGLIPEFQATHDRVKENKSLWEKMLEEREDILLATAEGKNAEARKAALIAAKQQDRDYQQMLNTLNGVRSELLQASFDLECLKREWVALSIQIHVFTTTLQFLAGANKKEETTHVGEA